MAAPFKVGAVLEFVNKAGAGIKAATKDLGGLEQAAKDIKKALFAGGVVMAGKAAYELGVLGAQSLRTKRAFAAISGGAFTAADNLDAMRRATRGAMSEQDMMASANQLLQMGLASNAAELENITTMATRLGSAMGKEAGPAVAEFSLMLANQSIPRLDTFGISAGKVRARMLELQRVTPSLTREMAFMTAVNEEGAEALDRLGEAAEDELLASERLEASWKDLTAMAGEMLAPAMAEVAATLTEVIKKVRTQKEELDTFIDVYGKAAIEAQVLKHGLWESADAAEEFNQMMAEAAERAEGVAAAVESGRSQIDGWSSAIFVTAEAATEAAGAMYELNTSAKTVATSFGEMEFDDEQLWKMAAASGASLDELGELAQVLGIATESEITNTLEGYKLIEMFGEGLISTEDLTTGFDDLAEATLADEEAAAAARIESEKLRDVMREGGEAAGELQEGTENAAGALLDFKDEIIPVNVETYDFGENIDWVNSILHDMAGEYTVTVHYQHTGTPPGAPPGAPMQAGTSFHRGGWALIGERGPELVALPRGSRVWPASAPQTRAAVNNRYNYGGDTVIINDRLASALYLESRRRRRIERVERM